MTDRVGQRLGNYRLVRKIGQGGFAEVYLGQHIHIQREAAIKILLKLEPDEIEQFRQEAQIIAQLLDIGITLVWSAFVAFVIMMILKYTIGIRSSDEAQEQGLDLADHGEKAYNF